MKALLIGGTGTISSAISQELIKRGHELYLLNRGKTGSIPSAKILTADINDEATVSALISDMHFDVVVDFIAFKPQDIERDFRIFNKKTWQYIFISSASAYQKPPVNHIITESTPLINPYWQYSRDKAACEKTLMSLYEQEGFPFTIVRPSHTYGDKKIPVAIYGDNGSWQVIKRLMQSQPVPLPGDGNSFWVLTHNTDFANGFIGLMQNPHAIGQSVHITSDEVLTWNQIYGIIASKLGVKANLFYVPSVTLAQLGKKYGYNYEGNLLGDKAYSVIFDNSKLKSLVPGYAAKTRFDMGIEKTIANVLKHPEMQNGDEKFDNFCDKLYSCINNIVSFM